MRLEERIAHWVDLGTLDYADAYALQEQLAVKRRENTIPDTILFAQHPPVIDFGQGQKHNRFSPALVTQFGGDERAIIKHLSEQQGIGFQRTGRGSGGTYVGPGQLLTYPIVNHPAITGKPLDATAYKLRVDKIMYNTLRRLGVHDARIVTVAQELGEGDESELRKDRRDVWVTRDGRHYKLGGKGFRFSGDVALHGFNLYVTPESTAGFDYVEACGYSKEELDVMSVAQATGVTHGLERVRDTVLGAIQEEFGYTDIRETTMEALPIPVATTT